jgi:hypothetical protein
MSFPAMMPVPIVRVTAGSVTIRPSADSIDVRLLAARNVVATRVAQARLHADVIDVVAEHE